MRARARIGTSGYSYKAWDRTFYGETPKSRQLEFYSTQFPTIEINATFYRLPSEAMVTGWRDRVDEEFVYALKGSRFITHMKKLAKLDGALEVYFDRVAPMQAKTAVILWQLPGIVRKDRARLADFLVLLPSEYRHAVEFRHPSWYDDEIFDLLHKHKTANVFLSSLGMPMDLTATTDFIYIRFHGLEGGAAHDYTARELQPWADNISKQVKKGRNVYAYFNNDINVRAPENAKLLMEMIGEDAVQPITEVRPRFELDSAGRSKRSSLRTHSRVAK